MEPDSACHRYRPDHGDVLADGQIFRSVAALRQIEGVQRPHCEPIEVVRRSCILQLFRMGLGLPYNAGCREASGVSRKAC